MTKKIHNISWNFTALALLALILATLSSAVFFYISFKQYQKSSFEKYSAINFHVVNNYKIFLDNLQKQAELLGQKIIESKLSKANQIDQFLNRKFSLEIDLDTSISSSWIHFSWVEKGKIDNSDYDLSKSTTSPWVINVHPLHSTSTDAKDYFLPVSFAVTNDNGLIGVLTGKVNILDLVNFLKGGIENSDIVIAILNENYHIINRPTDGNLALPSNFFRSSDFKEQKGIVDKNFRPAHETYLTYQKLKSYPFTIVVGDNEEKVFRPFYSSLFIYLITFAATITIVLLLLRLLYIKIINPINQLSNLANQISNTKEAVGSRINSNIREIINLENALSRIWSKKEEIRNKSDGLEVKNDDLRTDIQELLKSYKLRSRIVDEKDGQQKISSFEQVLNDAITLIYPEIYGKKIVINRLVEKGEFDFVIDEISLINVVSSLISFAASFSDRGSEINVTAKRASENEFYIEIEDFGLGDEEWRRENCGRKIDNILLIDQLVKLSDGEIGYINKDHGVKYFIILRSGESKKPDSNNLSNVIRLYPAPS